MIKPAKEICQEMKQSEINHLIQFIIDNNGKVETQNYYEPQYKGEKYQTINWYHRFDYGWIKPLTKKYLNQLKDAGYTVELTEEEKETFIVKEGLFSSKLISQGINIIYKLKISACCGEE